MRWIRSTEALLARSMKDAEWRQFADLVSPSFFDVVPVRALLSQGRELVGNATDRTRFRRMAGETAERLGALDLGLALEPGGAGAEPDAHEALDAEARRRRGQRVLELYFAQLFALDHTLIDLRPDRFRSATPPASGPLTWCPGPYYLTWKPEFLDALRRIYRGFYAGDDAGFRSGLQDLELEPAEDLFRRHFGEGDVRSLRFEPRHFQESFHDIFVRCREAGRSLHPNFLALGFYLASLYDHLGALGEAYDVRAAFDASAGS